MAKPIQINDSPIAPQGPAYEDVLARLWAYVVSRINWAKRSQYQANIKQVFAHEQNYLVQEWSNCSGI